MYLRAPSEQKALKTRIADLGLEKPVVARRQSEGMFRFRFPPMYVLLLQSALFLLMLQLRGEMEVQGPFYCAWVCAIYFVLGLLLSSHIDRQALYHGWQTGVATSLTTILAPIFIPPFMYSLSIFLDSGPVAMPIMTAVGLAYWLAWKALTAFLPKASQDQYLKSLREEARRKRSRLSGSAVKSEEQH